MLIHTHSHRAAERIISKSTAKEVIGAITDINVPLVRRGATRVRNLISENLHNKGWSGSVVLHAENNISITSMKNNIGLCLQTGNMARFYADLLKLQYLYSHDKIESAIYILPTKSASRQMGDNMVNFERFTEEVSIFRVIITVPILTLGFEQEENK